LQLSALREHQEDTLENVREVLNDDSLGKLFQENAFHSLAESIIIKFK
jgi:hypothetical protein